MPVLTRFNLNLLIIYLSLNYSVSYGYNLYHVRPYSLTYYYGITGSDSLAHIFKGQFHRWSEHINSFEVIHSLPPENWFSRLVSPITNLAQVAVNITQRVGRNQNAIYELNPYVAGRFTNFSWGRWLDFSLAIGEGISYASSIPAIEKKTHRGPPKTNPKRLLNYLMLEASFAHPNYPQWQIITRIHHRSGAYGLYRAGNAGSNVIGLGIRYLFK